MLIYSPRMLDNMATVWEPEDSLDVYPLSERFRCVGTLNSGEKCTGSLIPPANHREARAILDDLKVAPINLIVSDGWLFPELHRLATLTLCSGSHRYDCVWHSSWRIGRLFQPEAVLVAHQWFNTIRDMPSRQAFGGLRRQPTIPESIADHIINSTQDNSIAQPEQLSGPSSSPENVHVASSPMAPPHQTVEGLATLPLTTALPASEHSSVQRASSYVTQDPATFDLYSATPPLQAQVAVASAQILRTDIQHPRVPAFTLGPAHSYPTSNSQQPQQSSTTPSAPFLCNRENTSTRPLDSDTVIAPSPPIRLQSTTRSSSGNRDFQRSPLPSPSSRESNQDPPANIHGLIASLPAAISNAVITALSSPTTLEDALKGLLSEGNGIKT